MGISCLTDLLLVYLGFCFYVFSVFVFVVGFCLFVCFDCFFKRERAWNQVSGVGKGLGGVEEGEKITATFLATMGSKRK